jgi:hypothetical protein
MDMLLIVSVLTGCSVATDTPTSAPVTGSHSAGPASNVQFMTVMATKMPYIGRG